MIKSRLKAEAIIIFVKSIKKGIEWYVHFIRKPVIRFAIILPKLLGYVEGMLKNDQGIHPLPHTLLVFFGVLSTQH